MVTVLRSGRFAVVIYKDDHSPAHVYVYGDGTAKFNLVGTGGEPELMTAKRMTKTEIRKAGAVIREHHAFLLQRWRDIHGGP